MAIFKSDGSSFKKVVDVHNADNTINKINRVWVHDGTKFVLVKGRLYEVVWEKDLSEWGGTSWNGNYQPSSNVCTDMHILDDGSLLAVMPEYLNNYMAGTTNAGRYALAKFDPATGNISKWGNSNWVSWRTQTGYTNYLQPSGLIKLKNYFVFYTYEFGIYYMYNTLGNYVSQYFNSGLATSTLTFYNNTRCSSVGRDDKDSDNIYIGVITNAFSNGRRPCCYRLGYNGSSLRSDLYRHHSGFTEYKDVLEVKPFYCPENDIILICYGNDYDYSFSHLITVSNASSSSTANEDFPTIASLYNEGALERPLFCKDGYVYLSVHDGEYRSPYTVSKRRLSDLSLVWKSSVPRPNYIHQAYGEAKGYKQPCCPYEDGFITDFGLVVHEDGRMELQQDYIPKLYPNTSYYSGCLQIGRFKDNIGYAMFYSGNDFCSIVKLKEVKK